MNLLIIFVFGLGSISANAIEPQCRSFYSLEKETLTYSNRALSSNQGEALSEPCLHYFLEASQKEFLPVVNGKLIPIILDIRLPQDDLMDTISIIFDTSPRTKTKIEVHSFFEPDENGINDLKVLLLPKGVQNDS